MSRPSRPADDPPSRADRSTTASESFDALLTRVGNGDRDAFATVYDRIAPALLMVTRSRGLPTDQSEVVVEQVLLHLWRAAPRYARHREPASDWLRALIDEAFRDQPSRR